MSDNTLSELEKRVREAALELSRSERNLAQEYLLRLAAGINTFQAQKMAEVDLLPSVREAQAEYEIALNRMRKFD